LSATGNIVSNSIVQGSTINGTTVTGTTLSASGNVTGGNLITVGNITTSDNKFVISGRVRITSNAAGGYINQVDNSPLYLGANSFYPLTISQGASAAASNISVSSNLAVSSAIIATGNVTAGNIITAGQVSATGNITGGNLSGTGIVGTLTTAAQTNITSVGTLGSLSVTGNVTGGNLLTSGNIVDTGALSVITGSSGNINLAPDGTNVLVATTTGANVTGTLSASGNITGGNLSVSTGTITAGNIVNSNANGVGNIGSSTVYFNTVFAQATSAQYADVAEYYESDFDYEPGTVVKFGTVTEITLANQDHDPMVAGVVSEHPAFIMNSALVSDHTSAVALVGRVPCKVRGPVKRGQMMVTAGDGYARAETAPNMGTVIGKALENFDGEVGEIEILVGRL
jgi:hypothetical protein